LYSNHSCDANLRRRGEITFVVTRDIEAGEELTPDWAVTNDEAYLVEYNCGAPDCQKSLIGKDQRRLDLQKRYSGYFSGYLAQNRSFGDAALGAAHKQF
jgi:hypothetical protein